MLRAEFGGVRLDHEVGARCPVIAGPPVFDPESRPEKSLRGSLLLAFFPKKGDT